MPIRLNLTAQKGWKTKNPETRRDVLVLQFINQQTNEMMFQYAPKWNDIPIWLSMVESLCQMEIKKMKDKVHGVVIKRDVSN